MEEKVMISKEREIERYRQKIVPYYQRIVDIKLERERLEAEEKKMKEYADVPEKLRD